MQTPNPKQLMRYSNGFFSLETLKMPIIPQKKVAQSSSNN
jgi:hypothetical protein